jgi:hypothetical protein
MPHAFITQNLLTLKASYDERINNDAEDTRTKKYIPSKNGSRLDA